MFKFNVRHLLVEQFPPVDEDVNLANLSLASADFNRSHCSLVQQLNTQEARQLSEMFEEEEEDIESTLPPFNDSVFEKKRVKFVSSPQFLTPKKRINNYVDLNGTDNGTPKAIIRDKYKRVSMALTTREEELEKEREARIYLEREHQELQEFTRLESEGLDDERRMSVHSNSPETMERLKWYEKSFKDSESLNLELS